MNLLTSATDYVFGISAYDNLKNQVSRGLVAGASVKKIMQENWIPSTYVKTFSTDPLVEHTYEAVDIENYIQTYINNNRPDCLMDKVNELSTLRYASDENKIEILGIDISW